MKIERLFIGLIGLLVVFFALSIIIWENTSLDIHLHDTYFIISSSHIALLSLFAELVNYMLYKFIGGKDSVLAYWILVCHLIVFLVFLSLVLGFGFTLRYIEYPQSSILNWAITAFLLSELLIAIYYFLPERKIKGV
jgi:heme/copper-type cytochrome/quinol oxidase subunit 1